MNVVQVNYVYGDDFADKEALLDGYSTLTGWSEALIAAGARSVTVVQRFGENGRLVRNGVDYMFCDDGGAGRPGLWTWPRRLHRAAAGARPDIVHVNGLIFQAQIWRLRRQLPAGSAIVVQDHGSGEPGRHSALRAAMKRRALGAADAFLFAAREQADAWRRAGLISPCQRVFEVMEASTSLRPVPRQEARRTSQMDGAPAVLWVGRLNANKDPLAILDGFEMILARLPEAVLTMIYSAEDLLPAVRERLRASAALQKHVRLVGRVPREAMPAFYSAADVFVLGSHHEGSGYALIEACACGLVPVVTDIPTFRVLTAGGSLGALWGPGDASAFARALVAVAQRDLAADGARVAGRFDRMLSWPAIGRQAMDAYREIVSGRRAAQSSRAAG